MTAHTTPQAWHAQTLHDYAEQLMVAVQMLAHLEGYKEGVNEARVAA